MGISAAYIRRVLVASLFFVCLSFAAQATPLENGIKSFNNKDYQAALTSLEPLARQGNPQAQLHLGMMYSKGWGVPENIEQGLFWTKLGMHTGYRRKGFDPHEVGASTLSTAKKQEISSRVWGWKPEPVPAEDLPDWRQDERRARADKDETLANVLEKRLGESGEAEGQVAIGWSEVSYSEGSGLPRGTPRKWFRLAAAQDHPVALRVMTLYGDLEALRKVQRLSETDPAMKLWLEQFYIEGKGVTPKYRLAQAFWRVPDRYTEHQREVRSIIAMYNADDALKTLQNLASKDDRDAQAKLSFLYKHGFGVKQDDAQAFSLAQKAAQGESWKARGLYDLGALYYEGRGVAQDFAQAYYWLGRAARHGDKEDGPLRQEDAGKHLNVFEREVIDFKLDGINPHSVRNRIVVVVAGLFIIFFAGRTGLKFSDHRKMYTVAFILYALFATPFALMDVFRVQGFLVIFCNWLVVYQLVFRKKTFWMKPFIGNFSEAAHAKFAQVCLLLINAQSIVWILSFLSR